MTLLAQHRVGRKNKYGARKTVIDGISFDSKREAMRYATLRLAEKGGLIRALELQPKFDCIVNGRKICAYKADFRYFEGEKRIVEDSKGCRTPTYKLKKKLVEALYNIEVRET